MRNLIKSILRDFINESRIIYSDEELENIAKKYPHKNIFRKQDGFAFRQAEKRGILDKITSHMTYGGKKYTEEDLEKIAKKYKTKKDFNSNDRNAYVAASSRGILDKITQHMETLGSKSKRMVYAYEFPDYNVVYVGLTYNEEQRKISHTQTDRQRKKQSSVLKFILEKGVQPIYKVISNGYIEYDEAQKLEGKTLKEYEKNGWESLNKVKTGGLGGLAFVISNEELEDIAKNYDNKSDFKKMEPAAYQLASKRKLLPNLTAHMTSKIAPDYTFEDLQKIAMQFRTKTEFMKNNAGAYSSAVQRGIIDDITKHMIGNSKFTDEELEQIAKKYKSKIEFKKGNRRAYSRALSRGIMDRISKHMVKPPVWNKKNK